MTRWPLLLLSLAILSSARLVAEVPANSPEAEWIPAVQLECSRRAAEDRFSGAVLVAKAGKPIFEAAYGCAIREKALTNTLDTKFRFGSMGKMFTGVAVMQLVQAGNSRSTPPSPNTCPTTQTRRLPRSRFINC